MARRAGDFFGQSGLERLVAQLDAFDGEGDVVGEEQEGLALMMDREVAGEDEQADGATGRSQCEDEQAVAFEGASVEGGGLAGGGLDATKLGRRQRVARRRHDC